MQLGLFTTSQCAGKQEPLTKDQLWVRQLWAALITMCLAEWYGREGALGSRLYWDNAESTSQHRADGLEMGNHLWCTDTSASTVQIQGCTRQFEMVWDLVLPAFCCASKENYSQKIKF